MSMKGFFGGVKGGFKLGKSKPKVQGRFLRMKSFKTKQKVKKNVNFAKKFFKKDIRVQKRWVRRKWNMIKRNRAEKSLESGNSTKKRTSDATKGKKKGGFNPFKFIMAIFAGWLINQLPAIMESVKKFIDMAKPVFETLKKWATGIVDFFTWIGDGIKNLWNTITGNTDSVDAEKKKLETENKKLKDTFSKQKKGFKDLEDKAKGEEKNLKKDMDDLNKEVDNELDQSEKVDPIQVLEDNKNLVPTGMGGVVESEIKNNPEKYNTKTKINAALSNVGVNSSKVKYRTRTIKSDLSTITFDGKTYSRGKPGLGGYIPGDGKGGSTYGNLKVDSSTKDRVITVPVTQPTSKTNQAPVTSGSSPNIGDKDSVNSKDLMLHGMEK